MNIKKYKPIRIFHTLFGYGWWWGEHFFFFKNAFAIIPMFRECHAAEYASNHKAIWDGDTKSWSPARQSEKDAPAL